MNQQVDLQKLLTEAAQNHGSGNFARAEELFQKFLEYAPGEIRVTNYLGRAISDQGRDKDAIEVFNKAKELQPGFPETYNNLGLCYEKQKMDKQAADSFSQAIKLDSQNFLYHYNFANFLYKQREFSDSEKHYKDCIKLNPNFAEAYVNLAKMIANFGRLDEAKELCVRAIQINPRIEMAYETLARIFEYDHRVVDQITVYEQLLRVNPNNTKALGRLVNLYQYTWDWQKLEEVKARANKLQKELIDAEKAPVMDPFGSLMSTNDPEENFTVAKAYCDHLQKNVLQKEYKYPEKDKNKKKLVIGYISYDCRQHVNGEMIKDMFQYHDRESFETHVYATNKSDDSATRKQIENTCDKFFDVNGVLDENIADMINENGVDILLDLTGHMTGARVPVFMMKPAPIQANMWAFPGTMGTDAYDYTIVSKILVNEEQKTFFSESFAYTKNFQSCVRDEFKRDGFSRADFSIPEDAFCFNAHHAPYKIDTEILDLWLRLLKQMDGSVLLLRDFMKEAKENISSYVKNAGFDLDRLIFSERVSSEQYYQRLSLMDLGLDTPLYSGATTTIDCLWAGLPLITVLGSNYASRAAASHIDAMGMYDELVVKNIEEYEEKALSVAQNPQKLQELKNKLAEIRSDASLFDVPGHVKDLENTYRKMWEAYCSGDKSDIS